MNRPGILVVGIGEALFDLFPDRQALGGAPLNAAVCAHQLARTVGGEGVIVSRIGQDALGQQVISEIQQRGMSIEHLQTDPDRDTGRVYVDFDAGGSHQFQIVQNVAWDVIQFDPDTEDLARKCNAVCFGTLAQRDGQSRNTIYRFLDSARSALRLLDVNLRQDFYNRRIIERSFELANAVKLGIDELPVVAGELGMRSVAAGEMDEPQQKCAALCSKFDLKFVALTRGERGTTIITESERFSADVPTYPATDDADSVGAGDAAAAAILVGHALRWPLDRVVNLANHTGAFVASQPGATPKLPDEILKIVSGE